LGCPQSPAIRFLQESTGKNIVILTAESKMGKLLDDAAYFKISEIMEFPAWETLPGEEISPSPDIVGKRLSILHQLLKKKTPQVVVENYTGRHEVRKNKSVSPLGTNTIAMNDFLLDHFCE
jgi:transcription-repair coupling factor (superfamily II helicase)